MTILSQAWQSMIMAELFQTDPDTIKPPQMYLALSASTILSTTSAAGLSEPVSGSNYFRQNVSPSDSNWSYTFTSTTGTITNINEIDFGPCSFGKTWGNIKSWALVDSSVTGDGTIIAFGTWETAQFVDQGQSVTIAPNAIKISIN